MDSRPPLYTPKRRRVRASRIAYPIFFLTIAAVSLGIIAFARASAGEPIVIFPPFSDEPILTINATPVATGVNATPDVNATMTDAQTIQSLPTLTPTPTPQFRAIPRSVRAECGRTAIHGQLYANGYGVNNVWVRVWFAQGGLPGDWQAVTGGSPQLGNGGYEITLDTKPLAGQWYVAVVNESGSPISEIIPIVSTDGGCNDGSGQQVFHLDFERIAGDAGQLALLDAPTATPLPTRTPFPTFTPTPIPTIAADPAQPPPPPTATPFPPDVRPPLASDNTGRTVQVPILMYHYLSVPPADADAIRRGLSVGPDVFRAHLITLREQGYTSISLTDLAYAIDMGTPLPPKPIVITFDDGYVDNYTNAYPILREEGFTATFFIFPNVVEERNNDYVTWEMVKEMQEGGMEIGSHTLTHMSLPGKPPARIQSELSESRRIIQERLGIEIRTLAYPYGANDQGVAHLASEAGYWIAVTTKGGTVHGQSNIMTLDRVRVQGSMFPNRLMDILADACDVYDEC